MDGVFQTVILRVLPFLDYAVSYITKLLTAFAAEFGIDLDELYGQKNA